MLDPTWLEKPLKTLWGVAVFMFLLVLLQEWFQHVFWYRFWKCFWKLSGWFLESKITQKSIKNEVDCLIDFCNDFYSHFGSMLASRTLENWALACMPCIFWENLCIWFGPDFSLVLGCFSASFWHQNRIQKSLKFCLIFLMIFSRFLDPKWAQHETKIH